MNITLTLTIEQINVLLRMLDAGPHAQVRQLIDLIITETTRQQQQQPQAASAASEVTE